MKIGKLISVSIIVFIGIALTLAVVIKGLSTKGCCYENKMDEGFVIKTRYEVIIDYFNGIKYEEIHWQE